MPTLLHRRLLLLILGGVAYAAACDFPQYVSALALVALVPLILFPQGHAPRGRTFREGFLFGSVASLGMLAWFWGTYPLSWAGVSNPFVGVLVIAFVWIAAAALLAAFFGVFAVIVRACARGDWRDLLIIPSAWVLLEFARSFALALFFWGAQSSLAPDWTFGFLGYPLVWLAPFAALAPLGGVYLLSFAGAAVNVELAQLSRRSACSRKSLAYVAVLFIALGAFAVATTPRAGKAVLSVALASTDLPPSFFSGLLSVSDQVSAVQAALVRAAAGKPDVIVLPEDSRALQYVGTTTVNRILAATGKATLLIDSTRLPNGFGNEETMTFYTTRGVLGTTAKTFLMPYGEYLPYLASGAAHLLGFGGWASAFTEKRAYQPGTMLLPKPFDGYVFGGLFCSEIIPDSLYRDLAGRGATAFVNVASDADLHGNPILFDQVLTAARMRAASNARFFLQATNGAPSFALSPDGSILNEGSGTLLVRAGSVSGKTLYTQMGDWPVALALGFFTWFAFRKRRTLSRRSRAGR